MIDKIEFARTIALLAAAFPKFTLTAATVEAYYLILSDLDLNLLKAAVLDLSSGDSPWFPSAGQIRAAAFRMIDEKEDRLTGADAWGVVMGEIRRVGWCGTPDFGSELIARAVDGVGGWRLLCASPEDTIHTTRARFIDAYEVFDKRAKHQERMLPEVREVVQALTAGTSKMITPGDERK